MIGGRHLSYKRNWVSVTKQILHTFSKWKNWAYIHEHCTRLCFSLPMGRSYCTSIPGHRWRWSCSMCLCVLLLCTSLLNYLITWVLLCHRCTAWEVLGSSEPPSMLRITRCSAPWLPVSVPAIWFSILPGMWPTGVSVLHPEGEICHSQQFIDTACYHCSYPASRHLVTNV